MEFQFLNRWGILPDQLYALDPDFVTSVAHRMKADADIRADQAARERLRAGIRK